MRRVRWRGRKEAAGGKSERAEEFLILGLHGAGAAPPAVRARAGAAKNLERIPGRAVAAARGCACERAGGRVRRVLAAEEWRLGGSDSLTPARPDQSRLRERAGRREEEGEAVRLSPGRGAGRDPASSARGSTPPPGPGPRDPARSATRAPARTGAPPTR